MRPSERGRERLEHARILGAAPEQRHGLDRLAMIPIADRLLEQRDVLFDRIVASGLAGGKAGHEQQPDHRARPAYGARRAES